MGLYGFVVSAVVAGRWNTDSFSSVLPAVLDFSVHRMCGLDRV